MFNKTIAATKNSVVECKASENVCEKEEEEEEELEQLQLQFIRILSFRVKGELQPKIIFCPPTNQLERGRWKKSQSVKRTGTGETSSAISQSLGIGAVHTTPGHTSKRVRDVKDSFR